MEHIYGIYSKSRTAVLLLGGLIGIYGSLFGIGYIYVRTLLIPEYIATGEIDVGIILFLFLLRGIGVGIGIYSYKHREIDRLFLRCRIDKEGMHCSGIFWKRFVLRWEDIRTYGTFGNSYAYASIFAVYFNTETDYYRKNAPYMLRVSEKRIFFEVREDILRTLFLFMPADMQKMLKEPLIGAYDAIFQRRIKSTGFDKRTKHQNHE